MAISVRMSTVNGMGDELFKVEEWPQTVLSAARDQGEHGSCRLYAFVGAFEACLRIQGILAENERLSLQELIHRYGSVYNWYEHLEFAKKVGLLREGDYPYGDREPPEQLLIPEGVERYKISSFEKVRPSRMELVFKYIREQGPGILSFYVNRSYDDCFTNGTVYEGEGKETWFTRDDGKDVRLSHAVQVTGMVFKEGKPIFIYLDSRGATGGRGDGSGLIAGSAVRRFFFFQLPNLLE